MHTSQVAAQPDDFNVGEFKYLAVEINDMVPDDALPKLAQLNHDDDPVNLVLFPGRVVQGMDGLEIRVQRDVRMAYYAVRVPDRRGFDIHGGQVRPDLFDRFQAGQAGVPDGMDSADGIVVQDLFQGRLVTPQYLTDQCPVDAVGRK